VRYKLTLSYNGTQYHGWQIQPNAITVQGKLNQALSMMLREEISTMGSGRTDTGVHAKKQVVHFDTTTEVPNNLAHKLNNYLPKDIAIHEVVKTNDDFHSRYDAVSRAYRYYLHKEKSPFKNELSYHFSKKLDLNLMNEGCQILFNHHDFECFSKVKTAVNNFNCEIIEAKWEESEDQIVFYIKADRFLRNMVRAIVGTMIDIGLKTISLEDFTEIIESKSRKKAGVSAPAHGLYLEEVNY